MPVRFAYGAALVFCAAMLLARTAGAQGLRKGSVEAGGGWAGFVDESLINHTAIGGAAYLHLTPRLRVGPELTYMTGPGSDRDLYLLGNVVFEFLGSSGGREPRVSPFLIAGAGLFQHRDQPFVGTYNSFTFVGGTGVRVMVTDRVYVAPDIRIGVEDLHLRATVNVGLRLGT